MDERHLRHLEDLSALRLSATERRALRDDLRRIVAFARDLPALEDGDGDAEPGGPGTIPLAPEPLTLVRGADITWAGTGADAAAEATADPRPLDRGLFFAQVPEPVGGFLAVPPVFDLDDGQAP